MAGPRAGATNIGALGERRHVLALPPTTPNNQSYLIFFSYNIFVNIKQKSVLQLYKILLDSKPLIVNK